MGKATELLNEMGYDSPSTPNVLKGNKKQTLTQYSDMGNTASPTSKTKGVLEAGVYNVQTDPMSGSVFFAFHDVSTDELLRFKDPRQESILEEIKKFWGLADNFKKMGFTHKRGLLCYGPPGTGKSCILKLVMEDVVKQGDVVFIGRSPGSLVEGLRQFREVEPDRKALVILEDLDKLVQYDEHTLLELFDGDLQMDHFLYLGTTNYLERIPERMLRANRFDRKIKIDYPTIEGRLAYLKMKLGIHEDEGAVQELADKTDGFSFGQLREYIVSVYCFEKDSEQTLNRIKNGLEEASIRHYTEEESKRLLERRFARSNTNEQRLHESVKSRASRLLNEFDVDVAATGTTNNDSIDTASIKAELTKKLDTLGIEGISVDSVDDDGTGGLLVSFFDDEDGEVQVLFSYEEDDGPSAILVDDDTGEEVLMVDLSPLAPGLVNIQGYQYINMRDISWLNKSTMMTILTAGDLESPQADKAISVDALGNVIPAAESFYEVVGVIEENGEVLEVSYKTVVRGGKKVRLPIVRRKKKKRMPSGQRAALARAARKSSRSGATKRKRKMSLKLRKRAHLKTGGLRKGYKIGG